VKEKKSLQSITLFVQLEQSINPIYSTANNQTIHHRKNHQKKTKKIQNTK